MKADGSLCSQVEGVLQGGSKVGALGHPGCPGEATPLPTICRGHQPSSKGSFRGLQAQEEDPSNCGGPPDPPSYSPLC